MDFLDDINGFKLIVTDNKKEVIDYISSKKKLIQFKVMSLSEFRERFYFSFDLKTIDYLMNKYDLKYDNALTILNNMIYLTKEKYENKKLNELLKYKIELDDNNLLIYDKLFKSFLRNKNVIVINNNLSKFDKDVFNKVSKITNVIYHNYLNPIYEHNSIRFNNINEEANYVAYSISKLINQGISISKIKLTNLTDEYINPIKRIFSFYNLKCDFDNKTAIYETKIFKEFINNLEDDNEKSLNNISKYKNTDTYKMIIDLINQFTFTSSIKNVKTLFIETSKRVFLENEKYTNMIEVVNYNNHLFSDDEYVFMLNFNSSSIPSFKKDESYISDEDKKEVLIDLVKDENKSIKDTTINIIKSIKNLTITYKDRSYFETYFPSNLIDEFESMEVNKDILLSYSSMQDKIDLAIKKDLLFKYGITSEEYKVLNNNYEIPYNSYDHKYKIIDKSLLKEKIDNKVVLSYTSLDKYSKCAFRYYVSDILKLDIYEETFNAFIGSLFHHVLQNSLDKECDIDSLVNEYVLSSNKTFSKKEMFYIDKLTNNIKECVKSIKEFMNYTDLKNMMFEKYIEIYKSREINVTFKGIIDKIMYNKYDDKVVMIIIDYKTYTPTINLDYIDEGLFCQLPIYLLLAKNMGIDNITFGGFYYEQILNNSIDKSKSDYKLIGYSNSDENILFLVDDSFENSNMIRSLKLNNDGSFYRYSKVIDNERIDNIISNSDKLIDNVIDNISDAKFDINPKMIDNKNIGCDYCKFKDICFMDNNDIKDITKRGEEDA